MWIGAQLEPKRQIENVQHGPPLSVPWCSLLVSEHKTHVPNSGNTKSSQPLHPVPSYSHRAPLPGLCTVASPLAQVGDNTFFFRDLFYVPLALCQHLSWSELFTSVAAHTFVPTGPKSFAVPSFLGLPQFPIDWYYWSCPRESLSARRGTTMCPAQTSPPSHGFLSLLNFKTTPEQGCILSLWPVLAHGHVHP